MRLVMAFCGTVHRSTCYAIRGRRVYKVVAPEIAEDEVAEFLTARKFDYVCGACLRRVAR